MSTGSEELVRIDAQPAGSGPRQPPAGEAKRFRDYDQSQQFLLPPSLDDWLVADDEARFISEIVDDLDLTAFYASYEKLRGVPPYDPAMMLKHVALAGASYPTDSGVGHHVGTLVTADRGTGRASAPWKPLRGIRRPSRRGRTTTARTWPISSSSAGH